LKVLSAGQEPRPLALTEFIGKFLRNFSREVTLCIYWPGDQNGKNDVAVLAATGV
jgi:hypothetical protein